MFFCSKNKKITTIKDLFYKWYIPSASVVFRREYLPHKLPDWLTKVYNGDYAMELLLADKGDLYYIDEAMSVYRQHSTNFTHTNKASSNEQTLIELFFMLDDHFGKRYTDIINKRINHYRKVRKFAEIKEKIPFIRYIKLGRSIDLIMRKLGYQKIKYLE